MPTAQLTWTLGEKAPLVTIIPTVALKGYYLFFCFEGTFPFITFVNLIHLSRITFVVTYFVGVGMVGSFGTIFS